MLSAYFDTSALVRLLHKEQYSDDLEAYINQLEVTICTSDLSRTEVIKALGSKQYNTGALARFFTDITMQDGLEAGYFGCRRFARKLDYDVS